ncbi:acyltransferase [Nocardiopsis sp. YSL2]|uniref:acyltransferase family protein n=1 Tax=Nocardiopsis sp. YSL2 TaxID=2939492 RepID=UPI0026F440DE|nr:acyltransferase [Nocardiopsis sp. YSL2]
MTPDSIDVRGDARPALTSLRFVAALLVFITHIAFLSPFANPAVAGGFSTVAHDAGYLGVSFFFVLSGFVLTWSARAGDPVLGFYRRRFMKIVPNHLVVFLPAVAVVFVIGLGMQIYPILVNYLFLLQAWVWNFEFAAQSPNSPTWSLGVEVFFYAVFPLFYVLVRRIRRDRVWLWWVATGLLILAIPVVVGAVTPSEPASPAFDGGTWLQQKLLLFFPVTRLPDFVLGMLTARLVQERRFVGIGLGWSAALTVAVYTAALFLPHIYAFAGLWAFPVALLIGASASRDPRRPGLLESRPAVWAGEASYAFYLVHLPLMMLALFAVGRLHPDSAAGPFAKMGTVAGILFILGLAAVTLLVSRLLFVAVERPAMRRWARPRSEGPGRRTTTGDGGDTGGEPDRPDRTVT